MSAVIVAIVLVLAVAICATLFFARRCERACVELSDRILALAHVREAELDEAKGELARRDTEGGAR